MTATFIQIPFPVFFDTNGDPLDNGYVYIGRPNEDPRTNPIAVYFDADLAEPAIQPLRTIRGRIDSGGSPANIYGDLALPSAYSMTVLNKNKELVFSVPSGTGFDSVLGNLAVTDGNTLTSTNVDGDIIIDPDGDGQFVVQTNTGIGTEDPSAPLDVVASPGTGRSVATHAILGRGTSKIGYVATERADVLNDVTAVIWGVGENGTSEKLRLQDDGKLGLGVTPAELFHVQDTTNPAYIKITGPDAGFAGLVLESPNQSDAASINYDTSADILSMSTDGHSRLSITHNDGFVGINTSVPDTLFQIQNNSDTAFDPAVTDGQQSAGTTIKVANAHTGTDGFGQLLFRLANNSTVARVVAGVQATGGNSYLSFVTDSGGTPGQRLKIDKDGLFTLNDDTIGFDTFTDDDTFGTVSGSTLASSESIKTYIQNQIANAGIPTGVIWNWAGAGGGVPSGWLLCDGTTYERASQPGLFAVIGTTYNTGGESGSQFSVPDFRGRVTAGVGSGQSLGERYGQDSVRLTVGQLPSHSHGPGTYAVSGVSGASAYSAASGFAGSGAASVTGTSGTTGSGQSVDIRQSTITMHKIIKA